MTVLLLNCSASGVVVERDQGTAIGAPRDDVEADGCDDRTGTAASVVRRGEIEQRIVASGISATEGESGVREGGRRGPASVSRAREGREGLGAFEKRSSVAGL